MIREYDFECIKAIRDGAVLCEKEGHIEKIDIKKSAERWWDIHHKESVMDKLFRKKARNIYTGDKCFNFSEPYIRLYEAENEIVFRKRFPEDVDTSDACEFKMWWDQINMDLHQMGYWLFDEG